MSQLQTKKSFSQLLDSENVKNRVKEVLQNKSNQFITSALSLVNSDTKLQECEPTTIFNACLVSASLDLPINNNLGFSYIIPYGGKAQFQIGYKGFKQLALRSGQFKFLHASDVREGEIKIYNRLTGEITFEWIENDTERENKKIVGYVSYFELLNGFSSTFYMTKENVDKHAKKYSQTFKKGFGIWKDDFESMALKTVTKLNLSKNAPMSIDMQKAIVTDQSVINNEETLDVSYVDNAPITPEEKLENIKSLVDEKSEKLTDQDQFYIAEVVDNQKINDYDKVLNILKKL